MKKFLLYTALIVSVTNLFSIDTNIYIENHYGATIKFKKGAPNSTAQEISVPNQKRSVVGPYGRTMTISIRTTGKGSRFVSYFTELTKQIQDISRDIPNNKDKDAIIIIKPSRSYENWDIEINWEAKNQKLEDLSVIFNVENELENIIKGSLGQDYAEKARAIDDYDYTKATKRGQINLRRSLLSKINETTTQTYKKNRKQGAIWIAPDLSTIEDLKTNIDMLYKALQKYKTLDNQ